MKLFSTLLSLCACMSLAAEPVFAQAGFVDDPDLPASWETTKKKGYKKRKKKVRRPWYQPRVAIGSGLAFPEIVPFDVWLMFGKHFAIRGFYAPPVPLRIRVEMPSDVISTKKKVGVANPDFTIRFKAIFGPQYGFESYYFPWGDSFFVAAGGSFRQIELHGETKSPLYVCSLIEAAKDPPCGDPDKRLTTNTEIELEADARTTALMGRGTAGWMWHVGRVGFVTLYGGYAQPFRVKSHALVYADLDTPSDEDQIQGALAEVRVEKEKELREKAMQEIAPTTNRGMPVLGIGIGFRF